MPREIIVIQSEEITSMNKTHEFKIVEYTSRNELYRLYEKRCYCFLCCLIGDVFNHKPKPFWSHIDTNQDIEKLKMRVSAIISADKIANEKPVKETLL